MIPRLIDEKEGPWISYLKYNLKKYGGCFPFRCNYDVNDLDLSLSKFYLQLLRWWADFRCSFSDVNYSQNVILSFQMRRMFSLSLILLRAKRMFGRFNAEC